MKGLRQRGDHFKKPGAAGHANQAARACFSLSLPLSLSHSLLTGSPLSSEITLLQVRSVM